MLKKFPLNHGGCIILPSWMLGVRIACGEAEGKVRMLADAKCELTKAGWVIGGIHWL